MVVFFGVLLHDIALVVLLFILLLFVGGSFHVAHGLVWPIDDWLTFDLNGRIDAVIILTSLTLRLN